MFVWALLIELGRRDAVLAADGTFGRRPSNVSGNPKGTCYSPEQGSILGIGAEVPAHDVKATCHSILQLVMVDNATVTIPNLYDVVLELRQ